jgi:hypothetical protein
VIRIVVAAAPVRGTTAVGSDVADRSAAGTAADVPGVRVRASRHSRGADSTATASTGPRITGIASTTRSDAKSQPIMESTPPRTPLRFASVSNTPRC